MIYIALNATISVQNAYKSLAAEPPAAEAPAPDLGSVELGGGVGNFKQWFTCIDEPLHGLCSRTVMIYS